MGAGESGGEGAHRARDKTETEIQRDRQTDSQAIRETERQKVGEQSECERGKV